VANMDSDCFSPMPCGSDSVVGLMDNFLQPLLVGSDETYRYCLSSSPHSAALPTSVSSGCFWIRFCLGSPWRSFEFTVTIIKLGPVFW
jgi:hypothetical protein